MCPGIRKMTNGAMPNTLKCDSPRKTDAGFPRPASDCTLLAVGDVAEMLNVPVSWVYERTRKRTRDRIPGFRLGKYWRFDRKDVVDWIERQRVDARPNA
jgi:excisionase family DNA binding protein